MSGSREYQQNRKFTTTTLDDVVTMDRQPGGEWVVCLAAGDRPATLGVVYADGLGGWVAFANDPDKTHKPPVREQGDGRMSPSYATRKEAASAIVRFHVARSLGLRTGV